MTRVGILGGGQLGKMMAERALQLGLDVLVVDPDEGCCASAVAPLLSRDYGDPEVLDALGRCDVVTYESESVPLELLQRLEPTVPVHPRPRALEVVRDRLGEKRFLRSLGIPTAGFRPVSDERELRRAVRDLGLPAILKTRFGGYDAKGQRFLSAEEDIGEAWRSLRGQELILEAFVPFDREISLIGARSRRGEWRHWAPSENVHVDGMLRIARSPARGVDDDELARGRRWLERIGRALDYAGVLTVEFFAVGNQWVANEMACRVHNSGHWTIEGAATSQFENHLRAVADLPLGSADSRGSSAMVNLIGSLPETRDVLSVDRAQLHRYGKEPRPDRKVGHVTLQVDDDAGREVGLRALVAVLDDRKLLAALEPRTGRLGRKEEALPTPRPPSIGARMALRSRRPTFGLPVGPSWAAR